MNKILNKTLKILFPFYNKEKHGFLFNKWWFRLLAVIYPIAIILFLFWYFNTQISIYTACYNGVMNLYDYGTPAYKSLFAECQKGVYEAMLPSIGISVLMTVILHYVSQFLFFKPFIYIIYGKKK